MVIGVFLIVEEEFGGGVWSLKFRLELRLLVVVAVTRESTTLDYAKVEFGLLLVKGE